MGSIKLPHASGNSMSIAAPATNPASDLELKLPATIGTAGQFLTVDGSGNLVWANPPGITHADTWRLTTNTTANQTPINSNLERSIDANGNDGFGTIGAAMTQSSGVFTFPVTGIWKVEFYASWNKDNPSATTNIKIIMTLDGGSSDQTMAQAVDSIGDDSTNTVYSNAVCSAILDITDVSQRKVSFDATHEATTCTLMGNGDKNQTYFNFIRLGDT